MLPAVRERPPPELSAGGPLRVWGGPLIVRPVNLIEAEVRTDLRRKFQFVGIVCLQRRQRFPPPFAKSLTYGHPLLFLFLAGLVGSDGRGRGRRRGRRL